MGDRKPPPPWLDNDGREISRGLVELEKTALSKVLGLALDVVTSVHLSTHFQYSRYEVVHHLVNVLRDIEEMGSVIANVWGDGDDPERDDETGMIQYCNYYSDGDIAIPWKHGSDPALTEDG